MPLSRIRALFDHAAAARRSLDALVQGSANQQSLTAQTMNVISAGLGAQQAKLAQAMDALVQGLAQQRSMLARLIDLSTSQDRKLADIAEAQSQLLAKLDTPEEPEVPTSVADMLQFAGFATVSDFLNKDETAELAAVVNEVYDLMDRSEHFKDVHPDFGGNFRGWFGVWLEQLPKYLALTSPELASRYDQVLELIRTRARRHLGDHWVFYPHRSFFRRHIGVAKAVPWHIDADAAGIARTECVNVWLPLDAVGRELPTLEVVPHSHFKMRQIPLMTEDEKYRDDEFVATIGASHLPVLDPGDALIFDQYTLHRTQRVGPQDIVRTACEFRFELLEYATC